MEIEWFYYNYNFVESSGNTDISSKCTGTLHISIGFTLHYTGTTSDVTNDLKTGNFVLLSDIKMYYPQGISLSG